MIFYQLTILVGNCGRKKLQTFWANVLKKYVNVTKIILLISVQISLRRKAILMSSLTRHKFHAKLMDAVREGLITSLRYATPEVKLLEN